MLTMEDNELITRVGKDTPAGRLFRQYWLPAALSSEVPHPDCDPLRVRLLGEDMIAFRDTDGRPGLLDVACPHRGASLFYGRNEQCGLRCIYHGWKFDVDGRCVDMPNEPPDSNYRNKVRQTAYPCVERGGIVWTFMGEASPPPELPDHIFNLGTDDQVRVTKMSWQQQNWLQALEGTVDPCHSPFLHSRLGDDAELDQALEDVYAKANVLEIRHVRHGWKHDAVDADFGVMVAARRPIDDSNYYVRVNLFMMPCATQTTANSAGDSPWGGTTFFVPCDDTHTLVYVTDWHPTLSLTDAEPYRLAPNRRMSADHPVNPDHPGSEWITQANRSNDYLLDRELQRTKSYSGIPGPNAQDLAVTESMGPIVDRTKEHLGRADRGIIATRRRLLRAIRALRDHGETPPGAADPKAYRARAAHKVLQQGTDWQTELGRYLWPAPGTNLSMPW